MLWTLCSAACLSLLRNYYSNDSLPPQYATFLRATSVVYGVISGAILAGMLVVVYTRYRFGPPCIQHPGHWLLLISGIVTLVYLPLYFLAESTVRAERPIFAFVLFRIVPYLAVTCGYFWAARATRLNRWRNLFWAMTLIRLLTCLSELGGFIQVAYFSRWAMWTLVAIPLGGDLVLGGWLFVVAVLDRKAGQRRDWLHWTGVATFLATVIVRAVLTIGRGLIRE
jgi:hypothetical protein